MSRLMAKEHANVRVAILLVLAPARHDIRPLAIGLLRLLASKSIPDSRKQ
jgi:hypothetical protein